jgi:hypothetical protein
MPTSRSDSIRTCPRSNRQSRKAQLSLRIEQGKIWIEEDWTKQGIANELLDAGVPPEDIVLGFQHSSKRPLTEFASA